MKLHRPSAIHAMVAFVAIVGLTVGRAGALEVDSDWTRLLDSMDFTSSHGSAGTETVKAGFLEQTGNAKLHPFGSVLHGVRPYGKLGLGPLPGREMGRSSQLYDRISSAYLDRDSGVDRGGASQHGVPREIDLAHPPFTDPFLDLVLAEALRPGHHVVCLLFEPIGDEERACRKEPHC